MKKNTKYKSCVLLGAIGYSSGSVFAKLSTAPSIILVMYRTIMTALMFLPFAVSRRTELACIHPNKIRLCLLGGVLFGAHFSLFCESVKYTDIASATILIDCEVLFVAPATAILFHEKTSRYKILGITLTLIGAILVIGSGGFIFGDSSLYGNLLSLTGAFFAALYTIISKFCRTYVPNSLYSFLVYMGASLSLLIMALIFKMPVLGYDPVNYLLALCFTIFCTLGGHVVFSWALKYVDTSFISTSKLLEPFLASIFALIIFGQIPSPIVIIGGIAAISGVFIYIKYT